MLTGKVAVVTGGSRGIGKAIALEMASCGADVVILYAGNQTAAEQTVAEIREKGRKGLAYAATSALLRRRKPAVKTVLETFEKVDILVNNAGITKDSLVLNMTEEAFDSVVNTNLKGAFHMIRQLYSHMMRRRSGRIINISSVAGVMGNAGQANYASAKAGMIGLTKSVARELAGRGITCNAIAPGFIQTDMTAKMSQKVLDAAVSGIPMKRMGQPEDIAKLAAFLCSDGAGYLTGQVIHVDGGLCM